jgi:ABC-2 type transport system permease protein
MRVFFVLLRRELSGFLASFAGYLTIAAVLFLLGLGFNDMLSKLNRDATEIPLTEGFFASFYFWIILLLTAPIMTMRSFALEKFSGTHETLMTSGVSDLQVVLAKFAGAWIFYTITWLPFLGYLLILRAYSNDPSAFDFHALTTTFLGIILVGAAFMALGCFASSLTRNQIVAAMVGYALGLTLFLLSLRSLIPAPEESWASKAFEYIAMTEYLQQCARGIIDTRFLTYYSSLTVFFLFLTLKAVEARRWR